MPSIGPWGLEIFILIKNFFRKKYNAKLELSTGNIYYKCSLYNIDRTHLFSKLNGEIKDCSLLWIKICPIIFYHNKNFLNYLNMLP